jgi:hypothetical protein
MSKLKIVMGKKNQPNKVADKRKASNKIDEAVRNLVDTWAASTGKEVNPDILLNLVNSISSVLKDAEEDLGYTAVHQRVSTIVRVKGRNCALIETKNSRQLVREMNPNPFSVWHVVEKGKIVATLDTHALYANNRNIELIGLKEWEKHIAPVENAFFEEQGFDVRIHR